MAWQLIYTSAVRSLEAGRSGFGTVARHRAISPLLVSAIERSSQFSRLPGIDAGRVIFSYRIIAVAGGRFHVLSSIRDAGADYTGRTNHIAHHLIADPREVARLGVAGPSPADVLLAASWATAWTDPPRYLESEDEVALASIRPQTDGAAWRRITGNPESAGLLASGEAARGAYVISPEGVDLRGVFGESLRRIPERLWQIAFTTSLQPSDETADFRWIGVEAGSPLRAQAEASGRPILNLTEPATLLQPEVENVPAPISGSARSSVARVETAVSEGPVVRTRASLPASVFATRPGDSSDEINGGARKEILRVSHGFRKSLLVAVAGLFLVSGIVASIVFVKPAIERKNAREALAARFRSMDFFPDSACRGMADELIPTTDASRGQALADASGDLVQMLRKANLASLDSPETKTSLEALENRDGRELPAELGRLREIVKQAQTLARPPAKLADARDAAALAQIIDAERAEITKFGNEAPAPALVKELFGNADRQQAAALLAMLQNPLGPPEATLFERAVNRLETSDGEAKKTLEQIREKLLAPSAPAPRLALPTSPANADVLANPVPGPVLYVVAKKEGLPSLEIDEYAMELDLELRNDQGETTKFGFKQSGLLRKDFHSANDGFRIENKRLSPEPNSPAPPFVLIGRDAGHTRQAVFAVYVGLPTKDQSLLPETKLRLALEGDTLRITSELPRFAKSLEAAFTLLVPVDLAGAKLPKSFPVNSSAQCDLRDSLARLRQQIAAERQQEQSLGDHASKIASGQFTLDDLRMKAKQSAVTLKLKNRDALSAFGGDEKSGAELVGDFAKALAYEWEDKSQNFEELRLAGRELGDALNNLDAARARNKILLAKVDSLAKAAPAKAEGCEILRNLCTNLEILLGGPEAAKLEAARLQTEADRAKARAVALEGLPALNGKIPSGEYSLMVKLKDLGEVKVCSSTLP